MSRWISVNTLYVSYLAEMMDISPSIVAQCLVEFDGETPIAGVIFDDYTGNSIYTHIWIATGRIPSRRWWWKIHDYLFRQLEVKNAVATLNAFNTKAIKLCEKLGYKYTASIPDYYADGCDCLIYIGLAENAKYWRKFAAPKSVADTKAA